MNTRPTPETDKFFATFADGEAAPSHAEYYARLQDLERERDEARFDLDFRRRLGDWQNKTIHDLTKQRDEAREIYQKSYTAELARANYYKQQRDRLAVALRDCREDSVELLGERDWWQNEPRCDCQKRYQETRDNVTRADEALQSLTPNEQGHARAQTE
jgi:uncharacterized protein YciW